MWYRNLVNEEDVAHWGPLRQKKCTQAANEGLKVIRLLYNPYKKATEAKCRLKCCVSVLYVLEEDRTGDSNRVLQDLTNN